MKRLLLPLASLLFIAWTPLPQGLTPPARLLYPEPIEGLDVETRAASNGRGFFAVSAGGYFAMPIGENGERLSEESSAVGRAVGLPVIASDGTNYLVVWLAPSRDFRTVEGPTLYARRITAEGRPIDREPILIQRFGDRYGDGFSVSWDGARYVVVYNDRNQGYVAQYISAEGVVEPRHYPMAGSESDSGNGKVLSVTHQVYDIINEQPLVVQAIDTPPVTIGLGAQAVVAAGGGEFLVAYHEEGDLWVRRLAPSGQPLADPVRISIRASEPRIAWMNDHWLVVFTRLRGATRNVEGVRVGSGYVSTPFPIAENASVPALASNGTRAFVSWRGDDRKRYKAILDGSTVSAIGPLYRRLGPIEALNARMVAVGNTTLIAIGQTGQTDVWGVRGGVVRHLRTFPGYLNGFTAGPGHALLTTANWTIIDENANTLAEAKSQAEGTVWVPAGWAGSEYRVVWGHVSLYFRGVGDLYLSTMRLNGDTRGHRLLSPSAREHVATANARDRMLVVWPEECRGCFAGEISGTNELVEFEGQVRPPNWNGVPPRLHATSDGENFLLAITGMDTNMHLRLVAPDGRIERLRSLPVRWYFESVWMGWTGEYYLILGTNSTDPYAPGQLYAARVAPDGTLIDEEFALVLPDITTPDVRSALVRETGEVEILVAGQDEPFGPYGVSWRRLAGPRRRAVR
jgi:hypothetical protein